MGREIKFRIWCSYDKVMLSDVSLLHAFTYSVKGTILRASALGDTRVLMQCTGFKDCNGVEIYDGDIAEYKGTSPHSRLRVGQVMWQDFRACWAIGKPDAYNNDLFSYVQNGGYCKVIGNIYAKPEPFEPKSEPSATTAEAA